MRQAQAVGEPGKPKHFFLIFFMLPRAKKSQDFSLPQTAQQQRLKTPSDPITGGRSPRTVIKRQQRLPWTGSHLPEGSLKIQKECSEKPFTGQKNTSSVPLSTCTAQNMFFSSPTATWRGKRSEACPLSASVSSGVDREIQFLPEGHKLWLRLK